jgi:hypothetical protein
MTASLRSDAPERLLPWVVRSLIGVGLAITANAASQFLALAPSPEAGSALNEGVALAGLLLVPAAIFTAVVGAMFPTYWKATPQALVRFSPHAHLLTVLAVTLGYGVMASIVAVLAPVTWLVAIPVLVGVGVGSITVIWLIGHSLAIMDPLRLAQMVHDWGLDPRHTTVAIHDLARLARGMIERERKHVATEMIRHIEDLVRSHRPTDRVDRAFVHRVLDEAEEFWTDDSAIAASVYACRLALTDDAAAPDITT